MIDYGKIKDRFVDELNDVLLYIEMSKESEEGDFERQILKDIAKDEYTHAKCLKLILDKKSNIELDESDKKLWNTVEETVKPSH